MAMTNQEMQHRPLKPISALSWWRCPEHSMLVKVMAVLVTATFVYPSLSWAFESLAYAGPQTHQILFNQKAITIPEKLATTVSAYQGQDRLVVHIQDLHCNFEVQSNIAAVIEHLAKEYNLKLVAVEGASLPVNTTPISTYPNPKVRTIAGRHFMRQGKMDGAEFYASTGKYKILLDGVETDQLYNSSRGLVNEFLTDETQGYVFDLRELLNSLKADVYPAALAKFDARRQAYREGEMTLLKYALHLSQAAKTARIPLANYPNVAAYVAKRQEILPQEVDPDGIHLECDQLDRQVRESLYTDEAQRTLDELGRRLDVMEKLLSISATPEELQEYRQQPDSFRVGPFLNFVRQYKDIDPILAESGMTDIDPLLKKAMAFYDLADQRSTAFVDNTLARMEEYDTRLAVLLTGGFHTDHLLNEMRSRNISFVSLRPRVTQQETVNPYFSLIRNRRTPLEKLLAQNQDILKLPPSLFQVPAALRDAILTRAQIASQPEALRVFFDTLGLVVRDGKLMEAMEAGRISLADMAASLQAEWAQYPYADQMVFTMDWTNAIGSPEYGRFLIPYQGVQGLAEGEAVYSLIQPAGTAARDVVGQELFTLSTPDGRHEVVFMILNQQAAETMRQQVAAQQHRPLLEGAPVQSALLRMLSPLVEQVTSLVPRLQRRAETVQIAGAARDVQVTIEAQAVEGGQSMKQFIQQKKQFTLQLEDRSLTGLMYEIEGKTYIQIGNRWVVMDQVNVDQLPLDDLLTGEMLLGNPKLRDFLNVDTMTLESLARHLPEGMTLVTELSGIGETGYNEKDIQAALQVLDDNDLIKAMDEGTLTPEIYLHVLDALMIVSSKGAKKYWDWKMGIDRLELLLEVAPFETQAVLNPDLLAEGKRLAMHFNKLKMGYPELLMNFIAQENVRTQIKTVVNNMGTVVNSEGQVAEGDLVHANFLDVAHKEQLRKELEARGVDLSQYRSISEIGIAGQGSRILEDYFCQNKMDTSVFPLEDMAGFVKYLRAKGMDNLSLRKLNGVLYAGLSLLMMARNPRAIWIGGLPTVAIIENMLGEGVDFLTQELVHYLNLDGTFQRDKADVGGHGFLIRAISQNANMLVDMIEQGLTWHHIQGDDLGNEFNEQVMSWLIQTGQTPFSPLVTPQEIVIEDRVGELKLALAGGRTVEVNGKKIVRVEGLVLIDDAGGRFNVQDFIQELETSWSLVDALIEGASAIKDDKAAQRDKIIEAMVAYRDRLSRPAKNLKMSINGYSFELVRIQHKSGGHLLDVAGSARFVEKSNYTKTLQMTNSQGRTEEFTLPEFLAIMQRDFNTNNFSLDPLAIAANRDATIKRLYHQFLTFAQDNQGNESEIAKKRREIEAAIAQRIRDIGPAEWICRGQAVERLMLSIYPIPCELKEDDEGKPFLKMNMMAQDVASFEAMMSLSGVTAESFTLQDLEEIFQQSSQQTTDEDKDRVKNEGLARLGIDLKALPELQGVVQMKPVMVEMIDFTQAKDKFDKVNSRLNEVVGPYFDVSKGDLERQAMTGAWWTLLEAVGLRIFSGPAEKYFVALCQEVIDHGKVLPDTASESEQQEYARKQELMHHVRELLYANRRYVLRAWSKQLSATPDLETQEKIELLKQISRDMERPALTQRSSLRGFIISAVGSLTLFAEQLSYGLAEKFEKFAIQAVVLFMIGLYSAVKVAAISSARKRQAKAEAEAEANEERAEAPDLIVALQKFNLFKADADESRRGTLDRIRGQKVEIETVVAYTPKYFQYTVLAHVLIHRFFNRILGNVLGTLIGEPISYLLESALGLILMLGYEPQMRPTLGNLGRVAANLAKNITLNLQQIRRALPYVVGGLLAIAGLTLGLITGFSALVPSVGLIALGAALPMLSALMRQILSFQLLERVKQWSQNGWRTLRAPFLPVVRALYPISINLIRGVRNLGWVISSIGLMASILGILNFNLTQINLPRNMEIVTWGIAIMGLLVTTVVSLPFARLAGQMVRRSIRSTDAQLTPEIREKLSPRWQELLNGSMEDIEVRDNPWGVELAYFQGPNYDREHHSYLSPLDATHKAVLQVDLLALAEMSPLHQDSVLEHELSHYRQVKKRIADNLPPVSNFRAQFAATLAQLLFYTRWALRTFFGRPIWGVMRGVARIFVRIAVAVMSLTSVTFPIGVYQFAGVDVPPILLMQLAVPRANKGELSIQAILGRDQFDHKYTNYTVNAAGQVVAAEMSLRDKFANLEEALSQFSKILEKGWLTSDGSMGDERTMEANIRRAEQLRDQIVHEWFDIGNEALGVDAEAFGSGQVNVQVHQGQQRQYVQRPRASYYRNYAVALYAFKKVREIRRLTQQNLDEAILGSSFTAPQNVKSPLEENSDPYIDDVDQLWQDVLDRYEASGVAAMAVENLKYDLGISAEYLFYKNKEQNHNGRSFEELWDIALALRTMLYDTDPKTAVNNGIKTLAAEYLAECFSTYFRSGSARNDIDLSGGLSVDVDVYRAIIEGHDLPTFIAAEQSAFTTFSARFNPLLHDTLSGHSFTAMEHLATLYRKMAEQFKTATLQDVLTIMTQQLNPELAVAQAEMSSKAIYAEKIEVFRERFARIKPKYRSREAGGTGEASGAVIQVPIRFEINAGGIGDSSFLATIKPYLYRVINAPMKLLGVDRTVNEPIEIGFEIRDLADMPQKNGEAMFISVDSLDMGWHVDVRDTKNIQEKTPARLITDTLVSMGILPRDLLKSVEPGQEYEAMREIMEHVLGPGKGLYIDMNVKDIQAGSGLAISNLLVMGVALAFQEMMEGRELQVAAPETMAEKTITVELPLPDDLPAAEDVEPQSGYYQIQVSTTPDFQEDATHPFVGRKVDGKLSAVLPVDRFPKTGNYYIRSRYIDPQGPGAWRNSGQFELQAGAELGQVQGRLKVIGSETESWKYSASDLRVQRAILMSAWSTQARGENAGSQDDVCAGGGPNFLRAGAPTEGTLTNKDGSTRSVKYPGGPIPTIGKVALPKFIADKINQSVRILRIGLTDPAEPTLVQIYHNQIMNEVLDQTFAWAQLSWESLKALLRGDTRTLGYCMLASIALREKMAPVSMRPYVCEPLKEIVYKYGQEGVFIGQTGARIGGSVVAVFPTDMPAERQNEIMTEIEEAVKASIKGQGKIMPVVEWPHFYKESQLTDTSGRTGFSQGARTRDLSAQESRERRQRQVEPMRVHLKQEHARTMHMNQLYKPHQVREKVERYQPSDSPLANDPKLRIFDEALTAKIMGQQAVLLQTLVEARADEVEMAVDPLKVEQNVELILQAERLAPAKQKALARRLLQRSARGQRGIEEQLIQRLQNGIFLTRLLSMHVSPEIIKGFSKEIFQKKFEPLVLENSNRTVRSFTQSRLKVLSRHISRLSLEEQRVIYHAIGTGQLDPLITYTNTDLQAIARYLLTGEGDIAGILDRYRGVHRMIAHKLHGFKKAFASKKKDVTLFMGRAFMRDLEAEKEDLRQTIEIKNSRGKDTLLDRMLLDMLELAPVVEFLPYDHKLFTMSKTYRKHFGRQVRALAQGMHEGSMVLLSPFGGMGTRFGGANVVKQVFHFHRGNQPDATYLSLLLKNWQEFQQRFPHAESSEGFRRAYTHMIVSAFTEDAIFTALGNMTDMLGLDAKRVRNLIAVTSQGLRKVVVLDYVEFLLNLAVDPAAATPQARLELQKRYDEMILKMSKDLGKQQIRTALESIAGEMHLSPYTVDFMSAQVAESIESNLFVQTPAVYLQNAEVKLDRASMLVQQELQGRLDEIKQQTLQALNKVTQTRAYFTRTGLNPLMANNPTGTIATIEGSLVGNSPAYTLANLEAMGYTINHRLISRLRRKCQSDPERLRVFEEELRTGMPLAKAALLVEGDGLMMAISQQSTSRAKLGGGDLPIGDALDQIKRGRFAVIQGCPVAAGEAPGGVGVKLKDARGRPTQIVSSAEGSEIKMAEEIVYEADHTFQTNGTVFFNLKKLYLLMGLRPPARPSVWNRLAPAVLNWLGIVVNRLTGKETDGAELYLISTESERKQQFVKMMDTQLKQIHTVKDRQEELIGETYRYKVLQSENNVLMMLEWIQKNYGEGQVEMQMVPQADAYIDDKTMEELHASMGRPESYRSLGLQTPLPAEEKADPVLSAQDLMAWAKCYIERGLWNHAESVLAQAWKILEKNRHELDEAVLAELYGKINNQQTVIRKMRDGRDIPRRSTQELESDLLRQYELITATGSTPFEMTQGQRDRHLTELAAVIIQTEHELSQLEIHLRTVSMQGETLLGNLRAQQLHDLDIAHENLQHVLFELNGLYDQVAEAHLTLDVPKTERIAGFRVYPHKLQAVVDKDATILDPARRSDWETAEKLIRSAAAGLDLTILTGSTAFESWQHVFAMLVRVIDTLDMPPIAKIMAMKRIRIMANDGASIVSARFEHGRFVPEDLRHAEHWTDGRWQPIESLIVGEGEQENTENRAKVWEICMREFMHQLVSEGEIYRMLFKDADLTRAAVDFDADNQAMLRHLHEYIDSLRMPAAAVPKLTTMGPEQMRNVYEPVSWAVRHMVEASTPAEGTPAAAWKARLTKVLAQESATHLKLETPAMRQIALTTDEELMAALMSVYVKDSDGVYFSVDGAPIDRLVKGTQKSPPDPRANRIGGILCNRIFYDIVAHKISHAFEGTVFTDAHGDPLGITGEPRQGPAYVNIPFRSRKAYGGPSKNNYIYGRLHDSGSRNKVMLFAGDSYKDQAELPHNSRASLPSVAAFRFSEAFPARVSDPRFNTVIRGNSRNKLETVLQKNGKTLLYFHGSMSDQEYTWLRERSHRSDWRQAVDQLRQNGQVEYAENIPGELVKNLRMVYNSGDPGRDGRVEYYGPLSKDNAQFMETMISGQTSWKRAVIQIKQQSDEAHASHLTIRVLLGGLIELASNARAQKMEAGLMRTKFTNSEADYESRGFNVKRQGPAGFVALINAFIATAQDQRIYTTSEDMVRENDQYFLNMIRKMNAMGVKGFQLIPPTRAWKGVAKRSRTLIRRQLAGKRLPNLFESREAFSQHATRVLKEMSSPYSQELEALMAQREKAQADNEFEAMRSLDERIRAIEAQINSVVVEPRALEQGVIQDLREFARAHKHQHQKFLRQATDMVLAGRYVPQFLAGGGETAYGLDATWDLDMAAVEDVILGNYAEAEPYLTPQQIGKVLVITNQADVALDQGYLTATQIQQIRLTVARENILAEGQLPVLRRQIKMGRGRIAPVHIGMGPRQILQYRIHLENLATTNMQNPQEVLGRTRLVLNINEDAVAQVQRDLVANQFYGFNPDNVYIVVQPLLHGYALKDGEWSEDVQSPKAPAGHLHPTMQMVSKGEAIQWDAQGETRRLDQSVVQILSDAQVEMIGTHRINDLTRLHAGALNLAGLAYGLYQMKVHNREMVVEMASNPNQQPGAQWLATPEGEFLGERRSMSRPDLQAYLNQHPDAPTNTFRNLYSVPRLMDRAESESGIEVGMNVHYQKGRLYFWGITGDLTTVLDSTAFQVDAETPIYDIKTVRDMVDATTVIASQDGTDEFAHLARVYSHGRPSPTAPDDKVQESSQQGFMQYGEAGGLVTALGMLATVGSVVLKWHWVVTTLGVLGAVASVVLTLYWLIKAANIAQSVLGMSFAPGLIGPLQKYPTFQPAADDIRRGVMDKVMPNKSVAISPNLKNLLPYFQYTTLAHILLHQERGWPESLAYLVEPIYGWILMRRDARAAKATAGKAKSAVSRTPTTVRQSTGTLFGQINSLVGTNATFLQQTQAWLPLFNRVNTFFHVVQLEDLLAEYVKAWRAGEFNSRYQALAVLKTILVVALHNPDLEKDDQAFSRSLPDLLIRHLSGILSSQELTALEWDAIRNRYPGYQPERVVDQARIQRIWDSYRSRPESMTIATVRQKLADAADQAAKQPETRFGQIDQALRAQPQARTWRSWQPLLQAALDVKSVQEVELIIAEFAQAYANQEFTSPYGHYQALAVLSSMLGLSYAALLDTPQRDYWAIPGQVESALHKHLLPVLKDTSYIQAVQILSAGTQYREYAKKYFNAMRSRFSREREWTEWQHDIEDIASTIARQPEFNTPASIRASGVVRIAGEAQESSVRGFMITALGSLSGAVAMVIRSMVVEGSLLFAKVGFFGFMTLGLYHVIKIIAVTVAQKRLDRAAAMGEHAQPAQMIAPLQPYATFTANAGEQKRGTLDRVKGDRIEIENKVAHLPKYFQYTVLAHVVMHRFFNRMFGEPLATLLGETLGYLLEGVAGYVLMLRNEAEARANLRSLGIVAATLALAAGLLAGAVSVLSASAVMASLAAPFILIGLVTLVGVGWVMMPAEQRPVFPGILAGFGLAFVAAMGGWLPALIGSLGLAVLFGLSGLWARYVSLNRVAAIAQWQHIGVMSGLAVAGIGLVVGIFTAIFSLAITPLAAVLFFAAFAGVGVAALSALYNTPSQVLEVFRNAKTQNLSFLDAETAMRTAVRRSRDVLTVRLTTDNQRQIAVNIPAAKELNNNTELMDAILKHYVAMIYAQGHAMGNGPTKTLEVHMTNQQGERQTELEQRLCKIISDYFEEIGHPLISRANVGDPVIIRPQSSTPAHWRPASTAKPMPKNLKGLAVGLDIGGQGIKLCVLKDGVDVTDQYFPATENETEKQQQDRSLRYRYSYPYARLEAGGSGREFSQRLVAYVREVQAELAKHENKLGKLGAVFVNIPGAPDFGRDRMASLGGGPSRGFNKAQMAAELEAANEFIPELRKLLNDSVAFEFGNDMIGWGVDVANEAQLSDCIVYVTGSGLGTLLIENGVESDGINECCHLRWNLFEAVESLNPDSPKGSFEDWGGSIRGILGIAQKLGLVQKLREAGVEKVDVVHIGLAAAGRNPLNPQQTLPAGSELKRLAMSVWDAVERIEAQHIILLHLMTGKTQVAFGGGTTAGETGPIRQQLMQKYVDQYASQIGLPDRITINLVQNVSAAHGAALKAASLIAGEEAELSPEELRTHAVVGELVNLKNILPAGLNETWRGVKNSLRTRMVRGVLSFFMFVGGQFFGLRDVLRVPLRIVPAIIGFILLVVPMVSGMMFNQPGQPVQIDDASPRVQAFKRQHALPNELSRIQDVKSIQFQPLSIRGNFWIRLLRGELFGAYQVNGEYAGRAQPDFICAPDYLLRDVLQAEVPKKGWARMLYTFKAFMLSVIVEHQANRGYGTIRMKGVKQYAQELAEQQARRAANLKAGQPAAAWWQTGQVDGQRVDKQGVGFSDVMALARQYMLETDAVLGQQSDMSIERLLAELRNTVNEGSDPSLSAYINRLREIKAIPVEAYQPLMAAFGLAAEGPESRISLESIRVALAKNNSLPEWMKGVLANALTRVFEGRETMPLLKLQPVIRSVASGQMATLLTTLAAEAAKMEAGEGQNAVHSGLLTQLLQAEAPATEADAQRSMDLDAVSVQGPQIHVMGMPDAYAQLKNALEQRLNLLQMRKMDQVYPALAARLRMALQVMETAAKTPAGEMVPLVDEATARALRAELHHRAKTRKPGMHEIGRDADKDRKTIVGATTGQVRVAEVNGIPMGTDLVYEVSAPADKALTVEQLSAETVPQDFVIMSYQGEVLEPVTPTQGPLAFALGALRRTPSLGRLAVRQDPVGYLRAEAKALGLEGTLVRLLLSQDTKSPLVQAFLRYAQNPNSLRLERNFVKAMLRVLQAQREQLDLLDARIQTLAGEERDVLNQQREALFADHQASVSAFSELGRRMGALNKGESITRWAELPANVKRRDIWTPGVLLLPGGMGALGAYYDLLRKLGLEVDDNKFEQQRRRHFRSTEVAA